MTPAVPFETFPLLEVPFFAHGFVQRIPGFGARLERKVTGAGDSISEDTMEEADKPVCLSPLYGCHPTLEGFHSQVRTQLGFEQYACGEQVHGCGIAVLPASMADDGGLATVGGPAIAGVDGLITNRPGLCLGVRVADCCAVYLLDPVRRCIGLVHSGRKGTELGIVPAAIARMGAAFGTDPADLLVQLGPCIRPPLYEIDFAAEILRQARAAGVINVRDCGANTGEDLLRYYSYRMEKGQTGRMLALLGMKSRG